MQRMIKEHVAANRPYFVGRLPHIGGEMVLAETLLRQKPWRDDKLMHWLTNNAGLCMNTDQDAVEFVQHFLQAMLNTTQLCTWDLADEFPMVYALAAARTSYINAHALDLHTHYLSDEYELAKLYEGKTILVILSHGATFKHQVRRYGELFSVDKAPFRNANFIHLRPPQQHAGQTDGRSWRAHFEEFKAAIDTAFKENPSIQLVLAASGGFGMPVSDYIFKKHRTSVIYCGGVLQLAFGIRGARWESGKGNDKWIKPLPEDVPTHAGRVENGCYW